MVDHRSFICSQIYVLASLSKLNRLSVTYFLNLAAFFIKLGGGWANFITPVYACLCVCMWLCGSVGHWFDRQLCEIIFSVVYYIYWRYDVMTSLPCHVILMTLLHHCNMTSLHCYIMKWCHDIFIMSRHCYDIFTWWSHDIVMTSLLHHNVLMLGCHYIMTLHCDVITSLCDGIMMLWLHYDIIISLCCDIIKLCHNFIM